VDLFRRGEAPRDVKLLAAQGALALLAHEQLAILVLLSHDSDESLAATAARTLESLPRPALEAFLARRDVPADVRDYFAAKGIVGAGLALEDNGILLDLGEDEGLGDLELELEEILGGSPSASDGGEGGKRRVPLSSLSVVDRVKVAMRGTREQRAVLVRDANRIVSTAVLSSPKLTEAEVESFARMGNVSEDVLRIIASNRSWTKSYMVASALARNPKTPPTVSMPLVSRLNERDLKGLSVDRNAPEGLRIAARKLLTVNESRRK
jgi:hypothetical protein